MNRAAQPMFMGNTAKLYCLQILERVIREYDREITVLDLGCGTGEPVVGLLARYAERVRYVGIEPFAGACDRARTVLAGYNATVRNESAYDVTLESPADVILSFSVLEHVYDRTRYLGAVKRNLASHGILLINYDAGHFVRPTGSVLQRGSDRWRNLWGGLLARFGREHHFQRFVSEQQFLAMLERLDLVCHDSKFFNSEMKQIFKLVPHGSQAAIMEKWLEFELQLNESGIAYEDSVAPLFMTRNFVIVHADSGTGSEVLLPR